MKEDPIRELFKLYVQFHEEVKDDEELEEEGRAWFKKLEEGDEEAVEPLELVPPRILKRIFSYL